MSCVIREVILSYALNLGYTFECVFSYFVNLIITIKLYIDDEDAQ